MVDDRVGTTFRAKFLELSDAARALGGCEAHVVHSSPRWMCVSYVVGE